MPNSNGSSNSLNPLFNTDGFVGYWLKVNSTVAANMFTAPTLEPAAGTSQATVGDLKAVIKDGQWHLYEWNMDDPSQFDRTFSDVYGITATGYLGNNSLEASNSIDSIAILSTNGVNATVRIDQIGIPGHTGMGPDDPLLPTHINVDGTFNFINVASGHWFDPPLVDAYMFDATDGSHFIEVGMPPLESVADADGMYLVTSILGAQPVTAGANLIFASPVDFFTVSGITPLVNGADAEAFPIYLAFDGPMGSFTMTPQAGDFNHDGTVDAADYIVWRKTGGSSNDYNTWCANFGRTFFAAGGTGAGVNTNVPEPTTLVLLMLAAACRCLRRRRST